MRIYGCQQYKNLPENEKQKLVEYRVKLFSFRKSASILKSNDLECSFENE